MDEPSSILSTSHHVTSMITLLVNNNHNKGILCGRDIPMHFTWYTIAQNKPKPFSHMAITYPRTALLVLCQEANRYYTMEIGHHKFNDRISLVFGEQGR
jgi:hypothetical protein